VNKKTYLKLFEGNEELIKAARRWWEEVEKCDHPYGKLWFRHWQKETRAHPQIAFAFQKAVELGFNVTSEGHLACEIFERLYIACMEGAVLKKTMGLFSGPFVKQSNISGRSVTFIGIDVPDNAFDTDIDAAINTIFKQKNERGELAITWITPIEDIPGVLKKDSIDIGLLRDKLGLPHLRRRDLIIGLLWPSSVTSNAHIPTMLDGRWAFWVPVPGDEGWGKTMDLATGEPGVREGVIGGERREWELVIENGSTCRWYLNREYDPGLDGRYAELCEFLMGNAQ
jgi:hypothetical protein